LKEPSLYDFKGLVGPSDICTENYLAIWST